MKSILCPLLIIFNICLIRLVVHGRFSGGAVPMVTVVQSAANWRNTLTHVDRTHSLTHLHQQSYNHNCAKRQLSYYRLWNGIFIFEGILPENYRNLDRP